MAPLQVYRDGLTSASADSMQMLGIEDIGGTKQIRAVTSKKFLDTHAKFYPVLFAYHVAFAHALSANDPTNLADRWGTMLIPDISGILQIYGLKVAVDYLTHVVLQISMTLFTPTYVGGKLIAIDLGRDTDAVQRSVHRVRMANLDADPDPADRGGGGGGARGRKRGGARGERDDTDRSGQGNGPAPTIPLVDRPKPAPKTGAVPPTFAITKTIRDSPCANNSKGFPCAFQPCPYDHSK